jgi:hypothetical protein
MIFFMWMRSMLAPALTVSSGRGARAPYDFFERCPARLTKSHASAFSSMNSSQDVEGAANHLRRELYPPAAIVGGKITISAFGTRSGRTAVLMDSPGPQFNGGNVNMTATGGQAVTAAAA